MRPRHRHERWLHARIPEALEEALKREALRRRWPVSTLVRDVLEGALDMVEHIVEDSVEIARRSRGSARELAREWRHGPGYDTAPMAEDAKAVLKEVRGLVADVIDGVDELIGRVFQGGAPETAETWARVVTSREVDCVACGRHIGAG